MTTITFAGELTTIFNADNHMIPACSGERTDGSSSGVRCRLLCDAKIPIIVTVVPGVIARVSGIHVEVTVTITRFGKQRNDM